MNMALVPFMRTTMNMMNRFGGTSQLYIQEDTGTYDPENSEVITDISKYDIQCIALDYALKRDGDGTGVGNMIEAGDKQLFVVPIDGVRKPIPKQDWVIHGGKKYSITTVKEINPSGSQCILYELYLKE